MIEASVDSTRLSYLDGLRGVAVIMVIGTHALNFVTLDPFTKNAIAFLVQTIAVPSFFLADGFLFMHRHADSKLFDYKAYLQKSAFRLLVPWATFTCIYSFLRLLIEYLGFVPERLILDATLQDLIFLSYMSGIAGHLYFLPVLFLIRTFSFGTRFLASLPACMLLLIYLVYSTIFHSVDVKSFFLPGADPILLSLWGMQFYLLGMTLYKYNTRIGKQPFAVTFVMFALLIGFQASMPFVAGLIQHTYLIGAYCSFMALAHLQNRLIDLGQHTMGIYLLHAPVIIKGSSLAISFFMTNDTIPYFILLTAVATLASVIGTKLIITTSYTSWMLGVSPKAPQGAVVETSKLREAATLH
jgi:peptidoglycan/LPS O-acetylase OafA/YrhL